MKLIGTICGEKKMPRTEVTKKIWVYIKKCKPYQILPVLSKCFDLRVQIFRTATIAEIHAVRTEYHAEMPASIRRQKNAMPFSLN